MAGTNLPSHGQNDQSGMVSWFSEGICHGAGDDSTFVENLCISSAKAVFNTVNESLWVWYDPFLVCVMYKCLRCNFPNVTFTKGTTNESFLFNVKTGSSW